jgi:hypothetical protein
VQPGGGGGGIERHPLEQLRERRPRFVAARLVDQHLPEFAEKPAKQRSHVLVRNRPRGGMLALLPPQVLDLAQHGGTTLQPLRKHRVDFARPRMFVVFARAPRPDAVVWLGRRTLACMDALAWPAAMSALLLLYVPRTGVMGAVVTVLALLALRRLHAALLHNQRYRFTTWVWGCRLAAVVACGLLLKLVMQWT